VCFLASFVPFVDVPRFHWNRSCITHAVTIPAYLRPMYRELKLRASRVDRFIDRRTMTESRFENLLAKLGIVPGATIFLHSSMDEITRRVRGMTAPRLLQLLQDTLGHSGTLLLPTFPFVGKQYFYVQRNPKFDVKRTPSKVGLLTEVFRRLPGVVRSLHPTHPVAAWGRHAIELTSTHHLGSTFGETSPFYKIQNVGGRVVGLGTRIESYTILHVADDLHPKRRRQVFAEQHSTLLIDGDSQIHYQFLPLRPDAGRNLARVEKQLLRRGVLTYISAAGLKCATAGAADFIRASMRLAEEGIFL